MICLTEMGIFLLIYSEWRTGFAISSPSLLEPIRDQPGHVYVPFLPVTEVRVAWPWELQAVALRRLLPSHLARLPPSEVQGVAMGTLHAGPSSWLASPVHLREDGLCAEPWTRGSD